MCTGGPLFPFGHWKVSICNVPKTSRLAQIKKCRRLGANVGGCGEDFVILTSEDVFRVDFEQSRFFANTCAYIALGCCLAAGCFSNITIPRKRKPGRKHRKQSTSPNFKDKLNKCEPSSDNAWYLSRIEYHFNEDFHGLGFKTGGQG